MYTKDKNMKTKESKDMFNVVSLEPRIAGSDRKMVIRRSHQARDDQLPNAASRARRFI